MDLLNFESIANLTAAALVVVALYIMHLNNKAQNLAISAMSDATVKAISTAFTASLDTIQKSNDDQRALHKMEMSEHKKEMSEIRSDMERDRKEHDAEIAAERKERHEEVTGLKKRVGDLECEVDEKDKRIKSLETENAQLKAEIERLKGELNGKQDKQEEAGDAKKA